MEFFFKWIKQNLKIKSFLGTRKNTDMTQIWISLIAMMLIAFIKFTSRFPQILKDILRLLQLILFDTRSISNIFDDPSPPHKLQDRRQLSLFSNSF
jgi:putative transposase